MYWLFLAVVIIVLGFFYNRKQKSVMTLNAKETELVAGLIDKEKQTLLDQMLDMADEAALKGATISVESFVPITPDMKEELRQQFEDYKQNLIDTYGIEIPANTAHRLSMEMEGNGRMWSDYPGCFERHLQRRDGNPLFPPERRIVLRREIEEAIKKDKLEADMFKIKHKAFLDTKLILFDSKKEMSPTEVNDIFTEALELAEEGAKYGASVYSLIEILDKFAESLVESMNQVLPEWAENMRKIISLYRFKRKDYSVQYHRPDTPIRKQELMATLLSEDLIDIARAGLMCQRYELDKLTLGDESRKQPDKLPNTHDVKTFLEEAISRGFSKNRAARIMEAWNEGLTS